MTSTLSDPFSHSQFYLCCGFNPNAFHLTLYDRDDSHVHFLYCTHGLLLLHATLIVAIC